ncbi:YqaJ viral recombinase family protein [Herbaspirillum sp. CAH-3]|uniref:YqaJ viral recombinase family protein n=1 Tax=Herbaspirillum sp. CAH-3 TaxID=2605746 RepID=UPI0018A01214|nr:YqaJ viral recombinase family protein [Herbaspirillum sp. CAH-3]
MIIHPLEQGTEAWDQFRLTHYGASEAAAMLGLSKKASRAELLRLKYLGDAKQFSDWVQENILDRGHEVEALARPLVEDLIGEELYPVTCSAQLMPAWASYEMSASCDGLTMGEDVAFEHKQYNADLFASVSAGIVPEEHLPQCQQVLMVTGAKELYFVVSDGTREKFAYAVVLPDAEWQERILAGWCQFDKDLAAYQLPEAEKVLAAEPVLALPAVSVQVSGTIAVVNNFPAFEVAVRNFLANDLIREPKTDQDFVNLDLQIKEMKSGREAIKLAKGRIFSQMEAVDAAVRAAEMLDALLQQNCSMAEKLLASEKERRRAELIETARKAMAAHGEALQSEIQGVRLAVAMPDFAGAIKGLKSLTSMKEKLDAALANGKAAADMAAADIRKKLAWVAEHADEHRALLADLQQLVAKPMEDFQLTITSRIKEHQQRQEQERERIRAEAEARAQREQQKLKDEEDALIDRIWAAARRIEGNRVGYVQKAISYFEAGAGNYANDERPRVVAAVEAARAEMQVKLAEAQAHEAEISRQEAERRERESAVQQQNILAEKAQEAEAAAHAPRTVAAPAAAPRREPSGQPTLRLGQICERIAPLSITADGLAGLGFVHAGTDKAAKLYHESDFQAMCYAISNHVLTAINQRKEAA